MRNLSGYLATGPGFEHETFHIGDRSVLYTKFRPGIQLLLGSSAGGRCYEGDEPYSNWAAS